MRTLLISAFGCAPFRGSEIGVGWNWILQMAKYNIVHIITVKRNKSVIEANIPENLKEQIHFYFFDLPPFWIKVLKPESLLFYFFYFFWQIGIIPLIKNIKNKHHFDYSIHLTFGSIWMPTFLPFFDIPFIWGPIGGGESVPNSFLKALPFNQRVIESFRSFLKLTYYLNPLVLYPTYKAQAIIVRTNNTRSIIPNSFQKKITVCLETSMEKDIFNFQCKRNIEEETIKMIITGRLVPSKNVITAIRALASIVDKYKISLTIIGSGNEKSIIEQEIKKSHLTNQVLLISEVSRNEVINELSKSDIYLFPSLREGGSWALMEAMAVGLPVICLNWAGMEIITDDQSAIRLPVSDSKQMPKDMAKAICKLIDNPQLRINMGNAARERIQNAFSWEEKGLFMEKLFNQLSKTSKNE